MSATGVSHSMDSSMKIHPSDDIESILGNSDIKDDKHSRSVFVGNIPYETTEEELRALFSETGPVLSFRLVYDRESNKPKGYGFCEYRDIETAKSTIRNLNGVEIHGRTLRVDSAASEKGRDDSKVYEVPIGLVTTGQDIPAEQAPDTIIKVVSSLNSDQMFDLLKQMKECMQNNPDECRDMLIQNPQLAYALLQALLIMKVIDGRVAESILTKQNPIESAPVNSYIPLTHEAVAAHALQNRMNELNPSMFSQPPTGTMLPDLSGQMFAMNRGPLLPPGHQQGMNNSVTMPLATSVPPEIEPSMQHINASTCRVGIHPPPSADGVFPSYQSGSSGVNPQDSHWISSNDNRMVDQMKHPNIFLPTSHSQWPSRLDGPPSGTMTQKRPSENSSMISHPDQRVGNYQSRNSSKFHETQSANYSGLPNSYSNPPRSRSDQVPQIHDWNRSDDNEYYNQSTSRPRQIDHRNPSSMFSQRAGGTQDPRMSDSFMNHPSHSSRSFNDQPSSSSQRSAVSKLHNYPPDMPDNYENRYRDSQRPGPSNFSHSGAGSVNDPRVSSGRNPQNLPSEHLRSGDMSGYRSTHDYPQSQRGNVGSGGSAGRPSDSGIGGRYKHKESR